MHHAHIIIIQCNNDIIYLCKYYLNTYIVLAEGATSTTTTMLCYITIHHASVIA